MTTWTYAITARTLTSSSGLVIAQGSGVTPPYSGNGDCRDDPDSCHVLNHGPIPPGRYRIGPAYADLHLGPVVMHLDPDGWDGDGRTVLRIHGDNSKGDASASDGCLILPRVARDAVAASTCRTLIVTA
jgi:hypothetical protein